MPITSNNRIRAGNRSGKNFESDHINLLIWIPFSVDLNPLILKRLVRIKSFSVDTFYGDIGKPFLI